MTADVREYVHEDGRTLGAYVGSELEKVLATDPEWSVAEVAPAPAPAPESEPESEDKPEPKPKPEKG